MTPQESDQGKLPPWLIATGVIGLIVAVAYATLSSGRRTIESPTTVPTETTSAPVSDPSPDADLSEWTAMGNLRMDENRFIDAIRLYTHVIERDSQAVNVWVDRGGCRHALGDMNGALADFKAALELAPLHEIAHFNMGITYYSGGMPDSAAIWWNKLLLFAPESPAAAKALRLMASSDSGKVVP